MTKKKKAPVGTTTAEKRNNFIIEYAKTLNIAESCKTVGISYRTGLRVVNDPKYRPQIDAELEKIKTPKRAEAAEVLEYLSSVMRGEEQEEVVVTVGTGEGYSAVQKVKKEITPKDRVKAAELLGKVYGIFNSQVEVNGTMQVVFESEENLED